MWHRILSSLDHYSEWFCRYFREKTHLSELLDSQVQYYQFRISKGDKGNLNNTCRLIDSGDRCTTVLEIAHQLESQGQSIALLLLIAPIAARPNLSHSKLSTYGKFLRYFFRLLIGLTKKRPLLPAVYNAFFNRVLWHWKILRRYIPLLSILVDADNYV